MWTTITHSKKRVSALIFTDVNQAGNSDSGEMVRMPVKGGTTHSLGWTRHGQDTGCWRWQCWQHRESDLWKGWQWALHTDLRLHPWGCTKPQTVDGSSALTWGKMLISSFSFFSLDPNWDSVQRQQYDRLKIDVKSRSWKCLGLFRLVNVLWESRELQT